MARSTFGAASGDSVAQPPAPVNPVARFMLNSGPIGTFWDSQFNLTGQYTDLLDASTGQPITGLSTDQYGRIKRFQGPDGVLFGWVDFGAGRVLVADVAALVSAATAPTNTAIDSRISSGLSPAVRKGDIIISVLDKGAKGDGVADDTAAIQSAISAASSLALGGATVYFPKGTYKVTSTLTIAASGLLLKGEGKQFTKLNYSGAAGTACIASDNAAIRYECGIDDLFVSCITAGSTALALDNAYRWVMRRSKFESQGGTTGVGVDIIGALSKSTYFNEFYSCSMWGSQDSLRLGDNVNGTRVFGGVLEGPGRSLFMRAPNANMGTSSFYGVGIQSSGANTSGVIVQIGQSTDAYQCAYNTWFGCRVETSSSTAWVNEVNSWYNAIIGGSTAGHTSFTDKVTATGAGLLQLMHSAVSVLPFKFPYTVTANQFNGTSALLSGAGGANETTYGAGYIKPTGTGTSINLYVTAKGSGAVQFNASSGDPTAGVYFWSGGSSPALRAVIGLSSIGAQLKPALGADALWVYKNAGTNPDFKIGEDGKLSWGDPGGSGTFDATLSRSAASVLSVGATLQRPLSTKTANYTLAPGDGIVVFNGASLTATLPDPTVTTALPVGAAFIVKNVNASALTVVSAGTSKTVDGAASQSLAQWAKATFVSDGTQWLMI